MICGLRRWQAGATQGRGHARPIASEALLLGWPGFDSSAEEVEEAGSRPACNAMRSIAGRHLDQFNNHMLTPEQEQWINHLSDTEKVSVIPFDPTCDGKFLKIKELIQSVLGFEQSVEHRGASSLGISGQDEIDVYVPVPVEKFDKVISLVTDLLGKPRSHYPLKRARFVKYVEKKHIDIFVINQEDVGWKDCNKFHSFLLSHPQALDSYRKLKEESAGRSVREYYRRKIEFINEVLSKISEV